MAIDLSTTNLLLGILAAVSLLEAAAVLGVFVAGALVFHRLMQAIRGIEERQVAPAIGRVNSILDDVKGVTSTVKNEAERIDRMAQFAADFVGRCRARDTVSHQPS